MSDPGERAENLDQGLVKPTPTAEQRRFSAPQMEWDATRGAPPVESKPEAAQFPSQVYEFNHDPELFRAPASYPEPPKDMWYEVPKEKPRLQEKPRAIFPWEERDVSPPTRRFIEDEQPAATVAETSVVSNLSDELEVKPSSAADPIPPLIKVNDDNPWQAFASSRNAWDDDAGIDRYVRALNSYQKDRGNPTPHQRSPSGEIPTSANMPDPEDLAVQIDRRRESLILTDFPTAMERPSLPVTPAPRRRANFWGTEGHTVEDLPEAEGVPNQTEWVS
jgi:glycogenin glucosyltransferase